MSEIVWDIPTDDDFTRAENAASIAPISQRSRDRIRDSVFILRQPKRPPNIEANAVREHIPAFERELDKFRALVGQVDGVAEVCVRGLKAALDNLAIALPDAHARLAGGKHLIGKPGRRREWPKYHLVKDLAEAFESVGGNTTLPSVPGTYRRKTYHRAFLDFVIALFPDPDVVGLPDTADRIGDHLSKSLTELRKARRNR